MRSYCVGLLVIVSCVGCVRSLEDARYDATLAVFSRSSDEGFGERSTSVPPVAVVSPVAAVVAPYRVVKVGDDRASYAPADDRPRLTLHAWRAGGRQHAELIAPGDAPKPTH